jgi:hypothetical protein
VTGEGKGEGGEGAGRKRGEERDGERLQLSIMIGAEYAAERICKEGKKHFPLLKEQYVVKKKDQFYSLCVMFLVLSFSSFPTAHSPLMGIFQ